MTSPPESLLSDRCRHCDAPPGQSHSANCPHAPKLSPESPPDFMSAFDGGDWAWYVLGHDPDELHQIDDPELLDFERLWMRPIKASASDGWGLYDDSDEPTVDRDPETGRFKARVCWIECGSKSDGAVPFMGARYKP